LHKSVENVVIVREVLETSHFHCTNILWMHKTTKSELCVFFFNKR